MPVQQLLSFNDLSALGSSPDAVKTYFTNAYGVKPDGICVNSETYYNAVAPAITQQYGHPCYKTLGVIDYDKVDSPVESTIVIGSSYVRNDSDEEQTLESGVGGSWSEETSWSSSVTAGLTFSASIAIEDVFKVGSSTSFSTTIGESKTSNVARTAFTNIHVKVPAKSKIKVSAVGTLREQTVNFHAPITVQGYLGANFPNPVEGHYFWFADAGSVLPNTSGQLSGTIKNTSVFDVQITIGRPEAL